MERYRKEFNARVIKRRGCWGWKGAVASNGYTTLAVGRRRELGHRISYALLRAPVPPLLCVLHRCDNRLCTNPAHLFLGTRAENNQDRHAKGRTVMPRPDQRFRKVTAAMLKSIISMRKRRKTLQEIADKFGLDRSTVWRNLA